MADKKAGGVQVEGERSAQLIARMDSLRPTGTLHKVMALTCGGLFLDAMDVYLAGGVKTTLVESGFANDIEAATFLSAGFLGLFIGALLAGVTGDLLGRKKAFQYNLLLFGFATLLAAFAPNMILFIAFRFFSGLGLGSEIVTSFAMINEFAPVRRRGRWCAMGSAIANCGSPLGMFLCLLFISLWHPLGEANSWRLVFVVIGVAAIIVCILRREMPESPRWAIQHGKLDLAEQIIAQVEAEMKAKGIEPEHEVVEKGAVIDSDAHLARNLVFAVLITVVVSLTQYTYTTFGPSILKEVGLVTSKSLASTTITMLGAPLGALLGALMVERMGRRVSVTGGFVWVAVFALLYMLSLSTLNVGLVTALGFLMTLGFYVLNATVIGVYVNELFSTRFRFRGAGIANGVAKSVNVFMPFAVTWVLSTFSYQLIFVAMAVLAVAAAALVLAAGPETASKRIG